MGFSEPWLVSVNRYKEYDLVITDELEHDIWEDIENERMASRLSREQYDLLDEKGRAEFLAKAAVAMRMSSAYESTGENIVAFEAYPQSED